MPQGSVLGPRLFLIYINDLNIAIRHSTTFNFADDTCLLNKNKSLKKLNKQVNEDIRWLVTWLRANKISLNTSKTEIILFRRKHKILSKNLNFRLSCQGIFLKKQVTYLGVILDEHLEWSPHVTELNKKLSRVTGIISKLRHFVDLNTIISVYFALFDSHVYLTVYKHGDI